MANEMILSRCQQVRVDELTWNTRPFKIRPQPGTPAAVEILDPDCMFSGLKQDAAAGGDHPMVTIIVYNSFAIDREFAAVVRGEREIIGARLRDVDEAFEDHGDVVAARQG